MLLTLDVRQAGRVEAGSRLGGPEVGLLGPVLGLSAQTSEMGSLFGLEVIKLTVLKAASLMSVVMYSDTFTGTVICKDTVRQMEGKKTQTQCKYCTLVQRIKTRYVLFYFYLFFYCKALIYNVAVVLGHC